MTIAVAPSQAAVWKDGIQRGVGGGNRKQLQKEWRQLSSDRNGQKMGASVGKLEPNSLFPHFEHE